MKKRTIILFICLIIVCTLLVLNGTLFVVKDVEVVDWVEQGHLDKQQIAELSGVRSKNIFTVSESIASDNIEKLMPEVKVINIERKFPSTIRIVVLKRVPIIAVKYSGGYAIIDRECSVISNAVSLDSYDNITVLEGVSVTSVTSGKVLDVNETVLNRLLQIITTFETTGDNGYVGENFCLTVEKITFSGDKVTIKMVEGMELELDASTDCTNKIRALVSFFNNGTINGQPIDRTQGVYTTGEKIDGKYVILKRVQNS